MTECLGYRRFGAQGQDIGAAVSIALAAAHPGVVAGVHVPGVAAFPPAGQPVSAEGQAFLDRQQRWRNIEGGYAHLQATRPQTLAASLADSPAGLAAWITETFRAWSDGDVERRFSKDELLTTVTLYWVTATIGSSFLFYHDSQLDCARSGKCRTRPVRQVPHAPGPASRPAPAPRFAASYKIAMSVAMGYMLITMI